MSVDLGRQVGPFPVGGWVGIIVAGGAIGFLIKRSGFMDDRPLDTLDVDPEATPAPTPTLWRSGTSGAGFAWSEAAPTPDAPADNNAWLIAAIRLAVAKGITPSVADSALRNYVYGNPLSAAEMAVVDLVLASPLGPPPEGVPPITRSDTAPTPTAPTPAPTVPAPTVPTWPTVPVPPSSPPVIRPPAAPKTAGPHDPEAVAKTRTAVVGPSVVTIGGLAQQVYGNGAYWQELFFHNHAAWNNIAVARNEKITAANWRVPVGTRFYY